MSTSVPPRDGGTLTGSAAYLSSPIPDEQALHRLFEAEYAASVASATAQLGDAGALAPKVVETAFINLWQQRASLRDDAQVKAFLADELHHGAARALSRRAAAHRFGTHGGRDDGQSASRAGMSADAGAAHSWSEIEKAIRGEGQSGVAAHAAVASAGRKDAATHMKTVGKERSWLVPALIGIVVLAGLSAAGLYFDRLGEDDAILSVVDNLSLQPIAQSSAGQIGTVTLGDGTKLKIGPDTKIFVPDGFPSKIRAVRIEGTAQFDVAPGLPLPFRAVANKTHFVATGTSFIVSSFANDSNAMLKVREGTVTVKTAKGMQIVPAGGTLVVDGAGMRAVDADRAAEAFNWTDGTVTVHRHLREAVASMSRWFNMDIKVLDPPLLDRDASFSVALDSSRQAIGQVEKSANVKFSYDGETKVFRDAKAKK